MRISKWITLTICLLLGSAAAAQGTGKASLTVADGGDGTLTAVFRMGAFAVAEGAEHYSVPEAEGMTLACGEPGQPALPTLSTLLTLPRGATLRLTAVDGEERLCDDAVAEGLPLAPTTGAWLKDGPRPGYEPDAKCYATDAWHRGGARAEAVHVGTMGNSEVYRLTVRPVAYNPVRRSLLVSDSMSIALATTMPTTLADTRSGGERYLIVSRRQFREGLQPFVEWKRQEGYAVEELYADTNKREAVKALIESRWEDADGRWPGYILLVGDVAQIQSYIGTVVPAGLNGHATDLYYAEHTGDYLPDALMGRWPVNDTAELRAVVEKTLRYERCLGLDTSQLRRAILVAGEENSTPAPTTSNGQVNYLKARLGATHPAMDTVCHYNPASGNQKSEILAEIAQGASFLNYTAHCTTGGWSRPSIGFTSIDTLGCTQPMLYVNNCCQSNAFDGTCFGEKLLRTPQGGAIGVIGATNSTLWNEDYYWAVGPKYPFSLTPTYDSLMPGAFDRWFDGGIGTQGALLAAGNLAVTAFGSPYDKFYWEIYCLLGDPSLRPYMGAPNQLSLSVPDTVSVGTTSVRVGGTIGATISAVQGGQLLASVVRDSNRSSELRFACPADTLPIVVTATMAQAAPVVDTIHTALPQGRAVTFRGVTVADTAIYLYVVNIGTDTVDDLTVHLSCDDMGPAAFTSAPVTIDTLAPGAEEALRLTLHVLRWHERWSGWLEAYSNGDYVECHPLYVGGRLDGTAPSLAFTLCGTDTAAIVPNGIEPSTQYLLNVAVNGLSDAVTVSVSAMPGSMALADTTVAGAAAIPLLTPDSISHLHIEASVARGNYSRSYDLWLTAGARCDSFEEGLDSYPWDTTSLRTWLVDTGMAHTGARSLRSAPIGGRQTSDLALDLTLDHADSIAFWARTSSEQNYDRLVFSIDGTKHLDLSGNNGWRRCVYPLTPGGHRLLWRYVKDDSGNSGSDCAWIDDVEMPMALWAGPYGWFGESAPMAITEPDSHTLGLRAAPSPATDMVWITSTAATHATLTDMLGRRIGGFDLQAGQPHALNMGGLEAGVYIVRTDNGATLKIIKQ